MSVFPAVGKWAVRSGHRSGESWVPKTVRRREMRTVAAMVVGSVVPTAFWLGWN